MDSGNQRRCMYQPGGCSKFKNVFNIEKKSKNFIWPILHIWKQKKNTESNELIELILKAIQYE